MFLPHLFFVALAAITPAGSAALENDAALPIPVAMIAHAIRSDLVYNAPHLEIDLDGAKPSTAIDNLVRAKLLRVTGKTAGYGLGPKGLLVLMLTSRGERVALQRGWAFGGGVLQIPTGRLTWDARPYVVQRGKNNTYVTYFWSLERNDNLTYLLRLGAPSTWPKSMFRSCIPGNRSKYGPPQRRKVWIYRNNRGNWSSFEIYPISDCVTEK